MPINENAPLNVVPGAIRFNTDTMELEYYRGGPVGFGTTTTTGEWVNISTDSPDIQTGGTRGVFGGGYTPITNTIEYVTISTTGNALDFGDLTQVRLNLSSCSSSTRGLFSGGWLSPNSLNIIDYITISITGNAIDFGDLSQIRYGAGGCSSSTRGVFGGGSGPAPTNTATNIIDYITISSIGNAIDFGDLTQTINFCASFSSSTRGIFSTSLAINFVTISTLGNASNFGNLTQARDGLSGCSNSIRGILGGGILSSISQNTIDYVTISTLGNAVDFGDLTIPRYFYGTSSCSSSTRGLFVGGITPFYNVIDYVTIMSTGNAVDFGDLTSIRAGLAALSNGHGGLG